MANHKWMLDVFEDLREYAAKNGLLEIENHAAKAKKIVAFELHSLGQTVSDVSTHGSK